MLTEGNNDKQEKSRHCDTMVECHSLNRKMLSILLVAVIAEHGHCADTLKGVVFCMNDEECVGANRECSFHDKKANEGSCICKPGFVQSGEHFACQRETGVFVKETCQRDEDCRSGELCMTWQYDPSSDTSRKHRTGLTPTRGARHKLCIDSWIIEQHMSELEEPRTGGGLRSGRRDSFNVADEYYYSGRRPPRVHQQYIGFAEDMMLILFLVCILATLVTVHRATCYRQFQEARRNSPLRHLLPIAEDRPPPYSNTGDGGDSVDGIPEVVCSGSAPKRINETPPPSYEEALYRNTVRLPGQQTEMMTSQAVEITLEDSSIPSPPLSSIPGSTILIPPSSIAAPIQVPINTVTPISESNQDIASPTSSFSTTSPSSSSCSSNSSSSCNDQLITSATPLKEPKEEDTQEEPSEEHEDVHINQSNKSGTDHQLISTEHVIPV